MNNKKQELIEALLSSISHDIREPIRSIRGSINRLKNEQKFNREEIENLERIIVEISAIVKQFRDSNIVADFQTVIDFFDEDLSPKIENYFSFLIRKTFFKEKHKSIDSILKQSKRLKRIIEGIYDYAKTGGAIKKSQFGIHNEIDRIKKDLKELIDETGAVIESKGTVLFWGDQLKIAQVVQNLIRNAITSAKDNMSPVIYISFSNTKGSELHSKQRDNIANFNKDITYLYITVKDNGIGIPGKYLEQVFDTNFRIGRTGQGAHQRGGGLGLAIVKSVVEAHEGSVWIESELNSFTIVNVVLPNLTN